MPFVVFPVLVEMLLLQNVRRYAVVIKFRTATSAHTLLMIPMVLKKKILSLVLKGIRSIV